MLSWQYSAIVCDGNCYSQMHFRFYGRRFEPTRRRYFFFFFPILVIFSSLSLLLICISKNENIGIVSISFIVIHTGVHFKSVHLNLLIICPEDFIYL